MSQLESIWFRNLEIFKIQFVLIYSNLDLGPLLGIVKYTR